MEHDLTSKYPIRIASRVKEALQAGRPVLALESTVITHGLPWPANLALAQELEAIALSEGAEPATIAVVDGVIVIGIDSREKTHLAQEGTRCLKLSSFDLPIALARKSWGSTTVAGTLACAEQVGIRVFSTGGIGGVHRGYAALPDVSHDLQALSQSKLITVCAGAKAILDLPATWEYLETLGVLTVGFRCKELPAFYSRESGIPLPYTAEEIPEIAAIYRSSATGGLLVLNPVPAEFEIPREEVEPFVEAACKEARAKGVRGKSVTPFLLQVLERLTEGRSKITNCALLRHNVRVGSWIAKSLAG